MPTRPVRYDSVESPQISVREFGADDLTGLEFIEYLRTRWRQATISCLLAAGLAGLVSLALPKRYTATASVLIQPPAGNDPRGATAVSPVYLESLKTYEHFASSDTLFAQALAQLHLRGAYSGIPIETLKRRVLKVSKPRDTKILEISATLTNPSKAQALAEFIAKRTVGLNADLDDKSQQDLTVQARKLLEEAQNRVLYAGKMRDDFLRANPIAPLDDEIAGYLKLKGQLLSDLSYARTEEAGYEAQIKSGATTDPNLQPGAVSVRAHIVELTRQAAETDSRLKSISSVLEIRKRQADFLGTQYQAARAQLESAHSKNADVLLSSSFHGERLEIVDSGVVPERPSSPNIPLNVAIALAAALAGWLIYSAIAFSRREYASHLRA